MLGSRRWFLERVLYPLYCVFMHEVEVNVYAVSRERVWKTFSRWWFGKRFLDGWGKTFSMIP